MERVSMKELDKDRKQVIAAQREKLKKEGRLTDEIEQRLRQDEKHYEQFLNDPEDVIYLPRNEHCIEEQVQYRGWVVTFLPSGEVSASIPPIHWMTYRAMKTNESTFTKYLLTPTARQLTRETAAAEVFKRIDEFEDEKTEEDIEEEWTYLPGRTSTERFKPPKTTKPNTPDIDNPQSYTMPKGIRTEGMSIQVPYGSKLGDSTTDSMFRTSKKAEKHRKMFHKKPTNRHHKGNHPDRTLIEKEYVLKVKVTGTGKKGNARDELKWKSMATVYEVCNSNDERTLIPKGGYASYSDNPKHAETDSSVRALKEIKDRILADNPLYCRGQLLDKIRKMERGQSQKKNK